ncbi:MAG: hypothetical protein C0596_06600 [Marinilabiliales bacterium]|nr:MAG: hypothetical protein C0596_06600 [Marinilabiliales bacterium]
MELSFEQGEAESIYKSLDYYNKDLKFVNFQNAWDNFGGKGPLMEFVYLITQNESITAKLSYQIKKILIDSSDVGKEKIRLLRYTVLADSYGSKVKLKELNQFLQLKNDIVFLISLLQKEYLIKISGDNSHIIGLHPVRSKIIKYLLFDNEINKESDFVLDALSFINDNTVLNFLRNAFFYGGLLPDKLIERLKFFKPQTWQMYLQIFRGLLWKGIFDYTEKNIGILNEVYSDYGKSWITVVNFDFANNIDGGSMMQNVDIFTDEQKQYAKSINKKFSDKVEIFSYCKDWLSRINTIEIIPIGNVEWNSFGLFLFWLDYFGYNSIELNLSKFEFEKDLSLHSLDSISHTLYGIKKYNNQSYSYVDLVENIFLHKLSEKYNIICIEKHEDDISFHYLLDIVDDKFETEESDFLNAISMEVINLLRFAFPEKKQYNSNCVGHKFSFLPSEYDSSIKRIPQKNLPLKPLIEIN